MQWVMYLQEWESRGGAAKFAEEMRLDIRGLKFAREVRRQLSDIVGYNGKTLLAEPAAPPTGTLHGLCCLSCVLWQTAGCMMMLLQGLAEQYVGPRRGKLNCLPCPAHPPLQGHAVFKPDWDCTCRSILGRSSPFKAGAHCAGKSKTLRPLRKAILAGYATKLARRMPQHNGYKTVGPRGNLAQLHPSSAPLKHDEDGMLPQWLVYHELLQTARTFISKVS